MHRLIQTRHRKFDGSPCATPQISLMRGDIQALDIGYLKASPSGGDHHVHRPRDSTRGPGARVAGRDRERARCVASGVTWRPVASAPTEIYCTYLNFR